MVVASLAVFLLLHYNDIVGFLRARPDFEISIRPESIDLQAYKEGSTIVIITVTSINGLDSDIALDVAPSLGIVGVSFTIEPSTVSLPAHGQVTCILSIDVTSPVPTGRHYVDVIGTAGHLEHIARLTIIVAP